MTHFLSCVDCLGNVAGINCFLLMHWWIFVRIAMLIILKTRRNGMKKALSLVVAAGIIASAAASFGGSIVGSKHDFSAIAANGITLAGGVQGSSTQICIYCHAPHNTAKSIPLWNRTNPAGSLFTLYSGVNMENTSFRQGFTDDSTSLFCMSCHDGLTSMADVHNAGVIASGTTGTAHDEGVDSYRTAVDGVLTKGNIGELKNAALGSYNLSKTHPINFEVSTNTTQSDLYVGSLTGKMGNTNQFPLFRATRGDNTTVRSLECGSCHAVHDPALSPFLRVGMDKSDLCLGCHNK